MRTVLVLGAVLLIAGVAGLIIAPHYAPVLTPDGLPGGGNVSGSLATYDAIRIAGWACLIVGGILALFGLSISVRRPRTA